MQRTFCDTCGREIETEFSPLIRGHLNLYSDPSGRGSISLAFYRYPNEEGTRLEECLWCLKDRVLKLIAEIESEEKQKTSSRTSHRRADHGR